MRFALALLVPLTAAGCGQPSVRQPVTIGSIAPSPAQQEIERRMAETSQRVKATTLPSGWRVDCTDDHHLATKRCFAGRFGKDIQAPFQIYYINETGPFMMVGNHTHPTVEASVRVDDGAVWLVPESNGYNLVRHIGAAKRTIPDLQKGKIAYVTYWTLGYTPRRMEVELTGINEALNLLAQKVPKGRTQVKDKGKAQGTNI